MSPGAGDDPVLARRSQVARLVKVGQRVGYALFGVAVVVFFVGVVRRDFTELMVTVIELTLLIGSLVLAPAIVFGYAVRAADRADRDDDWR